MNSLVPGSSSMGVLWVLCVRCVPFVMRSESESEETGREVRAWICCDSELVFGERAQHFLSTQNHQQEPNHTSCHDDVKSNACF